GAPFSGTSSCAPATVFAGSPVVATDAIMMERLPLAGCCLPATSKTRAPMIRIFMAVAVLVVLTGAVLRPGIAAPPPDVAPCPADLKPGQWSTCGTASLNSIRLSKQALAQFMQSDAYWGYGTSPADAWGGMAYDQKGKCAYFWGGGHRAYGGN